MPATETAHAAHVRNFSAPDETRVMADKCIGRLLSLGGSELWQIVFEPGWRWSIHNRPRAANESCPIHHYGYVVAGAMQFRMDDGAEFAVEPGDVFDVPAGHDAWVIGEERCVFFHWAFGD